MKLSENIGQVVRVRLRQRPRLEFLREKGIYRDEPVFGCDLKTLCSREGQTIPKIIQCCVAAIEENSLETDGLYRICGNLSEVQKLRFQINHGKYDGIKSHENIHVITGLLKLFLRDLKEPVLPFDLFTSFVKTVEINDPEKRRETLRNVIQQLPDHNYNILRYLLEHLLRVVKHQDKNRMRIQNLAIVFGPSLIRPRDDTKDFSYDLLLRINGNKIVEELLIDFSDYFQSSYL